MSIKYIKEIDKQPEIDIIIPAAGMGRRMKSYGPKPLINIQHNTTVLDHQLKILKRRFAKSNIILVCGFEAEKLMNNSPDTLLKIENENYSDTNVARSIGMALRICSNDVLVVYGDLVFNSYCIDSINTNKSSMIVGENIMGDAEVGCIVNNKQYVENMMYDLPNKWGQITFFRGRELKLLKEICWNPDNYRLFGFEVINKILGHKGKFLTCTHNKAQVIDIDSSKDLNKVKGIV